MILCEEFKLIQGFEPKTTNAAINSVYVSLKNALEATVLMDLTQAVANATVISLYQAQDVSGTGAKAVSLNVPIWANEDVTVGDTLLRQVDGVSYTVANTAKNKQIIFHIDPAKLDVNNGFTCINVRISASAQVTNFASCDFILNAKYDQAVPQSAVTN